MMLEDEVQTLTRLGLTSIQARVYLALASSGISTAKTISKNSQVARPEVYRIMPTLEKLALVERIISTPCKFRANSMQDAVSVLIERRIKETSELQAITREMLKKFKYNNTRTALEKDESQFILIPQKEAAIERRRKTIENAQKSIDVVNSWKMFPITAFTYAEEIMKALQRGVKIRVITQKPKDKKAIPEIVREFRETLNLKVRYVPTPPPAVLSVYDKKEALMTTSATADLGKSDVLWSNNPCLLEVFQHYFKTLWMTAIEDKIAK